MSRYSRDHSKTSSCSTVASSQTNTVSTYTSRGSCDCDEEEMRTLRRAICIKLALVIFTLLGGAILALTINVWTRPIDDTDISSSFTHLSININGKQLCLNSNEDKRPILKKCNSNSDRLQQHFIYNTASFKIKENDMCVQANVVDRPTQINLLPDTGHQKVNSSPVALNSCLYDRKDKNYNRQSWIFFKKRGNKSNMYNKGTKQCLTANGEDKPMNTAECSDEDLNQRWDITTPSKMIEHLYSRSYVREYVFLDNPEEL